MKVSKPSINTAENLHSASKAVQGQHLLYRAYLLPTILPDDIDIAAMDLDIETVQAANWLNQYAPFQAYLDSIRTRSGIAPEGPTGLFGVSRALQLQSLSAGNTADTEEETVNSGLLALLLALTIKHTPRIETWVVDGDLRQRQICSPYRRVAALPERPRGLSLGNLVLARVSPIPRWCPPRPSQHRVHEGPAVLALDGHEAAMTNKYGA